MNHLLANSQALMRVVPLALVLLLSCFGCNRDQNGNDDQSQQLDHAVQGEAKPLTAQHDTLREDQPRFWRDEEVEEIIKSLGFDEVFVLRWNRGVVKSWTQFDSASVPETWEFDSAKTKIDLEDSAPSTESSSGQIVVAMTRKSEQVCDCRVVARVHIDGLGTVTVGEQGEIRLASSPHYFLSSDGACLSIKNGDGFVRFFEANFQSTP
jgi:hypothetical protein